MPAEPAQKPRISVVITDLDNTLFDWVAMWGAAFRPMLDEVVRVSGIPESALIPEIRKVHQQHHTSEYTFLLSDLQPLRERFPGQDLSLVFASAMAAYRAGRDSTLALYPGVMETLLQLKSLGVQLVGYTESHHFVTMWRMQRLRLDGVLDAVYSPPDHTMPGAVNLDLLRSRPDEAYHLEHTHHRNTPEGEYKPNPDILRQIVATIGRPQEEVVYVGDSLMKDVAMAQLASITDVHAEYGHAHDSGAYQLLRAVSHWTDKDVQREREILKGRVVTPTHVLRSGFDEVLGLFEFQQT